VCYDARTRNAKWVLERITSETVAKGAERTDASFYEEGGVDQRFRSKLR
jgi:DNA/RNA endonuclease G (NUC1)